MHKLGKHCSVLMCYFVGLKLSNALFFSIPVIFVASISSDASVIFLTEGNFFRMNAKNILCDVVLSV